MVRPGEQGDGPGREPGDEVVSAAGAPAPVPDESVRAAELLERLVDRLSTSVGASAVYGRPIERDGVTIIPVAKVGFGFGAGTGAGRRRSEAVRDAETGRGGGGGGGAGATPIGYIEIREGSAAFRPIHRPARELIPPVTAFVAGAVLMRLFRRVRSARGGRA